MPITKSEVDRNGFNLSHQLPYELRISDFESAMQDVYDFFFDVNSHLVSKGLQRLDDMLRPAIMSGVLSETLSRPVARASRSRRQERRAAPSTRTEHAISGCVCSSMI